MTRGRAKRILIVDDSFFLLKVTSEALAAAGYAVTAASNLAELDVARKGEPPDLVLMDVDMPEAFGDEIAAVMRSSYAATPIYLYSDIPPAELVARAKAAGATGIIAKGSGVHAMVERVRVILGDS